MQTTEAFPPGTRVRFDRGGKEAVGIVEQNPNSMGCATVRVGSDRISIRRDRLALTSK